MWLDAAGVRRSSRFMNDLLCVLSLDGPAGAAVGRDAGESRKDKVYYIHCTGGVTGGHGGWGSTKQEGS